MISSPELDHFVGHMGGRARAAHRFPMTAEAQHRSHAQLQQQQQQHRHVTSIASILTDLFTWPSWPRIFVPSLSLSLRPSATFS